MFQYTLNRFLAAVPTVFLITVLAFSMLHLIPGDQAGIFLGENRSTSEWGLMLSDGRSYLRHAWWITTFPGLAIMVTVLSINLLGDGLRDALDPRMR